MQVPDAVAFATKPRIACELIAAALDAGVPCAWVLADALYGSDSRLRRMLEERSQPYVLAVRSNHTLRMVTVDGFLQTDPAEMADGHYHVNFEKVTRSPIGGCCKCHTAHRAHVSCIQALNASERIAR